MKNLLFIGLGRMGAPMAGHLTKNTDFTVHVANRSPEKVTRWLADNHGKAHDANAKYDAIILCVGNDDDVRNNLALDGEFIPCLKAGGVVIDHTTTSADLAQSMSELLGERGIAFLDAPVSGGEAGAVNGKLSCMVGGDETAFNAAADIFAAYCHSVVYIGASGAGQISKMANQLCIAGVLSGLSEAICLVEKAGIDADKVYQAIKGGAAQSWQLDNRFPTMLAGEFDFGFAITHMIKDLNYALEETARQGWTPPVGEKVINEYRDLLADGRATQDTSVLVESYRKRYSDIN